MIIGLLFVAACAKRPVATAREAAPAPAPAPPPAAPAPAPPAPPRPGPRPPAGGACTAAGRGRPAAGSASGPAEGIYGQRRPQADPLRVRQGRHPSGRREDPRRERQVALVEPEPDPVDR